MKSHFDFFPNENLEIQFPFADLSVVRRKKLIFSSEYPNSFGMIGGGGIGIDRNLPERQLVEMEFFVRDQNSEEEINKICESVPQIVNFYAIIISLLQIQAGRHSRHSYISNDHSHNIR